MSSLPCKKVYIDTHFMVPNSESTSNFKVELGRTLQMPQDSVFYISDLVVPHSWYSSFVFVMLERQTKLTMMLYYQ